MAPGVAEDTGKVTTPAWSDGPEAGPIVASPAPLA